MVNGLPILLTPDNPVSSDFIKYESTSNQHEPIHAPHVTYTAMEQFAATLQLWIPIDVTTNEMQPL